MSFLISDAIAADAPAAAQPGMLEALLPFIILFVVFYFLLIRPQQKRTKEHTKMVSALQVGDEVVTNGGILGKVSRVGDDFIGVELADGVEINLQRQAVATVMPKGTMDNLG
ncbi:MAG: preprotein translocase subunit YajC [Gammaproteobacteria bacterium]|nr:preprotein translocase subunit YajC [Gammaproteobacteria bacterium]